MFVLVDEDDFRSGLLELHYLAENVAVVLALEPVHVDLALHFVPPSACSAQ